VGPVSWLLVLLAGCWPAYPDDWDGDGRTGDQDCDGARADVYVGAPEVWYDDVDQDCDGGSDHDADGDGHDLGNDCDDQDPAVSPDAQERWYDDTDQDCSGGSDHDADGDGHDGGVDSGDWDDCDDGDPTVSPSADEIWYDDFDQDCSGGSDHDADADGHDGGSDTGLWADCDDTRADVNPAATEICDDGVDNDCDGGAPECLLQGVVPIGDHVARVLGEPESFLGEAMAVGDVDSDGHSDVLVGASVWGSADQGTVYVLPGPLAADLDLGSLAWSGDTAGVLALRGFGSFLKAGSRIALVDVDGDGLQEALLGLPRSYALGGDGAVAIARLDRSGEVQLDTDDEAWLLGSGHGAEDFGSDVVPDGRGGLWIGASGNPEEWYSAGTAHPYGRFYHLPTVPTSDTLLEDVEGLTRYASSNEGEGGGFRLAPIGDMTGDGLDELAVGAPDCEQPAGFPHAGCVYVVEGDAPTGAYLVPRDGLVQLHGRSDGARTGYTLVGPGDVDGDGAADLLIGAPFEESSDLATQQTGAAFLVTAAEATKLSGDQELWEVAQARFTGLGHGSQIGLALGAVGDLDGDLHAEVAIHAYGGSTAGGVVHVLYGPITGDRTLSDQWGEPVEKDLLITGDSAASGDLTGFAIGGGDLTGDGVPDVLVSDVLESATAGALFVIAGSGP